MKVIMKKKLTIAKGKRVFNELQILEDLHHPNIIQLREVIDAPEEKRIYLVM
jgi:serine/threonine protein kinase